MSTSTAAATVALCLLCLVALAGIALVLLDDGAPLNVRPMAGDELEAVSAGIAPVSGVPVSPTLHHLYDGRVPGPVRGRATAATPGRHAGPGRARRTHRLANHAVPTLLTGSTL
jgi:hypothetical protein